MKYEGQKNLIFFNFFAFLPDVPMPFSYARCMQNMSGAQLFIATK